jgi:hypothetical protein
MASEYLLYSWGAVSTDGLTFPDCVKKIRMNRVNHCNNLADYCEECDLVSPEDEDMGCASVERGRGFTCFGDSGGPLFHIQGKKMTLIGLLISGTSGTESCGNDPYAIDAYVNIFHFKEQILSIIRELTASDDDASDYDESQKQDGSDHSRRSGFGFKFYVVLMIILSLISLLTLLFIISWLVFGRRKTLQVFSFRSWVGLLCSRMNSHSGYFNRFNLINEPIV